MWISVPIEGFVFVSILSDGNHFSMYSVWKATGMIDRVVVGVLDLTYSPRYIWTPIQYTKQGTTRRKATNHIDHRMSRNPKCYSWGESFWFLKAKHEFESLAQGKSGWTPGGNYRQPHLTPMTISWCRRYPSYYHPTRANRHCNFFSFRIEETGKLVNTLQCECLKRDGKCRYVPECPNNVRAVSDPTVWPR